MLASNVSRATLEYAARQVGVRADIVPVSTSGCRFRVKLYPDVTDDLYHWRQYTPEECPGRPCSTECDHRSRGGRFKDSRGDAKYQRESVGYGSAGRRVNAVCWHGFRDFFRAVFLQESDAVIASVCIAAACRCPDRGYAG